MCWRRCGVNGRWGEGGGRERRHIRVGGDVGLMVDGEKGDGEREGVYMLEEMCVKGRWGKYGESREVREQSLLDRVRSMSIHGALKVSLA